MPERRSSAQERRRGERRGSASAAIPTVGSLAERRVAPSVVVPAMHSPQAHTPSTSGRRPDPLLEDERVPAPLSGEYRATAQDPVEEPPVRPRETPRTVGGPSFLGLSGDDDGRSADYLLVEDEDDRSGGGRRQFAWRRFAVLLILLAVVALVFMQWRANYYAQPVTLEPGGEETSAPDPGETPAEPQQGEAPVGGEQRDQPAPPADSPDEPAVPPRGATAEQDTTTDEALTESEADAGAAADNSAAEAESPDSATTDSEDTIEFAGAGGGEAANESNGATTDSLLDRAQMYLQGRGVPQNCPQGMVLLRAAARRPDPRARIQLGALYASGHCVQQDKVAAYEWFTRALDVDPKNDWVERYRNRLWMSMSEDERQKIARTMD